VVTGQELERQDRRTAAGRAFVLEAPAQKLCLLAKPELPDRAVRNRPLAVVRRPGRALDLVLPLRPERGQLLLRARFGERIRFGGG
jgi:hypothetical protein